jgi:hypothetical protein
MRLKITDKKFRNRKIISMTILPVCKNGNLSQMLKECGMDAIALLENLGIESKSGGSG